MHNEIITIFGVTIYGYGLMIGVGVAAAVVTAARRAAGKGLLADAVWSMASICVLCGILGAKLFYYFGILGEIIRDPSLLYRDFGYGFVLYGGVIGGVLGGLVYCIRRKLAFWRYFDLVMPSVAIAQGFGRIGCFLAGCCHGKATESWFAVVFHNSGFAPNNVPLWPTQLMSAAGDFAIAAILIWLAKTPRRDGVIAGMYCVLYGVGRFLMEYARADAQIAVGPLTIAQFIAVFVVIAGWVMILAKKPRRL